VNRSRAADLDRIPAPALVIVGVSSVQLGAAIAKSLFDELTPTGLVMLRLVFGALVLGLLFRPRVRDRSSHELHLALAFGLTLVTMNFCFYQAIDRIPLGIAVTLEFVGPLGIALLGSRACGWLQRPEMVFYDYFVRQRAEREAFRVEARPVSWPASMRSLAHRLSLPEARRSQPRASLPARAARSASGRAS